LWGGPPGPRATPRSPISRSTTGIHRQPSPAGSDSIPLDVIPDLLELPLIPFLRGTSPWVLMDFRSPRRNLPDIQDFFNRKGLVGIHEEKKKAFFVMQEFYKSKQ
jgi:hypothetical protein